MPCHGIAVTTAQVNMDLGAFFSNRANQAALAEYLKSNAVNARSWWNMTNKTGWALAIDTLWAGVGFSGNEITISDEGEYQNHKAQIDRAYAFASLFVGQQIQANVINTFTNMGLSPRDAKLHDDQSIEVRIDLGSGPAQPNTLWKETLRVRIDLAGGMTLVTENGAYDVGKRKLELLLGLFGQQSGMKVTPSGEFETHKHDEQQAYVDQRVANGW